MKTIFYIILPVGAFSLILLNALFGHLLFNSPYNQDINKYSIYVHLESDWQSYPRNILYEVTNVWSNPNPDAELSKFNYDPSIQTSLVSDYNSNQLEYQNNKSYVELKHEFSNCEASWKPVLYRYAIDIVRNNFEYLQGNQLNNDPYVQIFPERPNESYDLEKQNELVNQGFAQFIPICTTKGTTSYDYSISVNDEKIGFDVYFVESKDQLQNYLSNHSFSYYTENGCFSMNHQSFSGTCNNVDSEAGILIVIPDNLTLSITKIKVNLHERL